MTIKSDNIQIGANATATQNFVLKQGADGTCTLARGNVGATTQDILTVANTTGLVTFTQGIPSSAVAQSMVRLNTANGYGSTNTMIRRFTNVVTNQGSDITYADSATLGASFTINTNGVYSISYSDQLSVANFYIGFSLNSSQLTTAVQNITVTDKLSLVQGYGGGAMANVDWCGYLPSGSIVRAHADSNVTGGGTAAVFTITRVS